MMSIGVLGFIVWSLIVSASSHDNMRIIYYLYFAICRNCFILIGTLNSKNSINYTKSAGNLFSLKTQSASETIRKTSFNFSAFHKYYASLGNNTQPLSDNWLAWFIGFSEGDGAIQTYANGKRVRFVLTQKEKAILVYIQNTLGIGTIKHFPQGKSGKNNDFYRLIVDDPSHILLLAFLFNGNLAISHRINQLSFWINALNTRFGYNTIIFNSIPVSISLSDAWLSGFTDAEGCFNVSITANSRYKLSHVIKMRFLLDQKDSTILNTIRTLFGLGKVTLRSQTNHVYRYTVTGFSSIYLIISYFEAFPLRTKKAASFNKWLSIHNIISSKLHLTEKGLAQVRVLQRQINIYNNLSNKTGSAHP